MLECQNCPLAEDVLVGNAYSKAMGSETQRHDLGADPAGRLLVE